MKKCPKCKAEIQEEARFCLYCMTAFEEKQTIETPNKRINGNYIIAAILAFALVILSLFFIIPKVKSTDDLADVSDSSSMSGDFNISNDNSGASASKQQSNVSKGDKTSSLSSGTQTQHSSRYENGVIGRTSGNTMTGSISSGSSLNETNTTKKRSDGKTTERTTTNSHYKNSTHWKGTTTKGTSFGTSTSKNRTSKKTSSNTTNTTQIRSTSKSVQNSTISKNVSTKDTLTGSTSSRTTTNRERTTIATTLPVATTATYAYRDARYGDDFSVSTNLENCIVITDVKTVSADGKYVIPETIDGKKVIAIMPLAFCDNSISYTVKMVVVPPTVKTIWNTAFENCYNLTDIYFKGSAIYTESNAFAKTSKRNGTLTIHCSANCSDRNYRYYRNSASYYDAEYEEWDG